MYSAFECMPNKKEKKKMMRPWRIQYPTTNLQLLWQRKFSLIKSTFCAISLGVAVTIVSLFVYDEKKKWWALWCYFIFVQEMIVKYFLTINCALRFWAFQKTKLELLFHFWNRFIANAHHPLIAVIGSIYITRGLHMQIKLGKNSRWDNERMLERAFTTSS